MDVVLWKSGTTTSEPTQWNDAISLHNNICFGGIVLSTQRTTTKRDEDHHKDHGFNWILMDSLLRDRPVVVESILLTR